MLTGSVSRIVLPEAGIAVDLNDHHDFQHISSILELPEIPELDKWIIYWFVVSRCIDLYIFQRLTVEQLTNFFP